MKVVKQVKVILASTQSCIGSTPLSQKNSVVTRIDGVDFPSSIMYQARAVKTQRARTWGTCQCSEEGLDPSLTGEVGERCLEWRGVIVR